MINATVRSDERPSRRSRNAEKRWACPVAVSDGSIVVPGTNRARAGGTSAMSPPVIRPRSTSTTGANGSPRSPRGKHPPRSTSASTFSANSASNRVLPTPASPPSRMNDGLPAAASSRAVMRRWNSSTRSTNRVSAVSRPTAPSIEVATIPCHANQLRLDGVEFAEPIGQTFLQPFAMQLEVSAHHLGLVGREDGADLVRRHLLTREHALGPAGRRARQRLVRAADSSESIAIACLPPRADVDRRREARTRRTSRRLDLNPG